MSRYAYQSHFVDGNGAIVNGGKITVYLTGTDTLATIYEQEIGGTAATGSFVTSSASDGSFKFFIDTGDYYSDQEFRLVLSITNFSTKTYDDVKIFPADTIEVSTLAKLQEYTGTKTVFLKGRTTDGDGGAGKFLWDSSDLSAEVAADEVTTGEGDGGIYVATGADKTGASGAWVRQTTDFVYIPWYGAISTATVQAAVNAGATYGLKIKAPAGLYDLTGARVYFYYDAANNPGFPQNDFATRVVFEGVNSVYTGFGGPDVYTSTVFNCDASSGFEVDEINGTEQQNSTKLRNFSIVYAGTDYALELKHFKKLSSVENVSIFLSATGGKGMLVDNAYQADIRDMLILGAGLTEGARSSVGITVDHSIIAAGLVNFSGVTTKGFDTGFDIKATNLTISTRLVQCQPSFCTVGINIAAGAVKTVIRDNYFEANDADIVDNGISTTIDSNSLNNVTGTSIDITSSAFAANVTGNRIGLDATEAGAIGIHCDTTNIQHNISGNSIVGANAGHIGIQFENDPSRVIAVGNHFVIPTGTTVDLSLLSDSTKYPAKHSLAGETQFLNKVAITRNVGSVASASTIDISEGLDEINLTGTATVNTITGGRTYQNLQINFSSTATIADKSTTGTNIYLSGTADFVSGGAVDMLVLTYNGAIWKEVSRSQR